MSVVRNGGDREPVWHVITPTTRAVFRRRNDALLFDSRQVLYGTGFVPADHGFFAEQSGKADAKRVRYTKIGNDGYAYNPVLFYSKKHDRHLRDKRL